MSFIIIAQSLLFENHFGNKFQIKIYQDLSVEGTPDPVIVEIVGQPKLRRGNSSAENKINNINVTTVDITLRDDDLFLYDRLTTEDQEKFYCEILKNNNVLFVGRIAVLNSKTPLHLDSFNLSLKIYDGLETLKSETDFDALTKGNSSIAQFFSEILNKIGFGLNLEAYFNIIPYPYSTPISPFDAIDVNIAAMIEIQGIDNYFNLLESLLKTLLCRLYQHNGYWIIQQFNSIVPGTNVIKTLINTSRKEVQSVSVVSVTSTIILDELTANPVRYRIKDINCFSIKANQNKNKRKVGYIGWKNPDFEIGLYGWTAWNNVILRRHSVNIGESSYLYQQTESLPELTQLNCTIKYNFVKFYSFGESTITPSLCTIQLIKDLGGVEYLQDNMSFSTSFNALHTSLIPVISLLGSSQSDDYAQVIKTENYTFTIPSEKSGKIRIDLLPGFVRKGSPYIYESAQFESCLLKLATNEDDDENYGEPPNGMTVTAYKKIDKNEVTLNVLYHDDNSENDFSLMNANENDERTRIWYPANKCLLEMNAIDTVKFNINNMHALEIGLVPGHSAEMKDLLTYNDIYYIPVYEETEIWKELKKFILVKHVKESDTINTIIEYDE